MTEKLTPKQKAFADAYIECGNASEAARRAGYKQEVQGRENLRKPTVSAYINERMRPTEEKRIASADEVLLFLSGVMRGEIRDQFGLDASLSDRISAAKELQKRHDAASKGQAVAPTVVNVDGALFENIADIFIPVHRDIVKMKHAEYWFKGGRASTKSSFISLEIVKGIRDDENANAVVFRKVGNTIKDSVYEQLIWAIEALGVSEEFTFRKSPLEIVRNTGQRIMFRGSDDPMKSKSLKLSRGYFKYLWFEELAEFRGMEDIRTIKQSVFRGVDKGVTLYSYNPPRSAQNWVNSEALKPRDDRLVHHSTYLDVPVEWLKEAFIAEANITKETNERAYRNEYLGEVTGSGGQVFDNLEERTITDEEINRLDVFYNGLDFGFAVDPDAFTRWAYDAKNRRLYAVAEFYGAHTPTATLADKITCMVGRELVTCDSADPRMISQLRELGVNTLACTKGPGSREHGYRWLQNLGAIVVDPKRTPNIAREFREYEYPQDAHGNFLSEYPDKNDHCCDSCRYALNRVIGRRTATTGKRPF